MFLVILIDLIADVSAAVTFAVEIAEGHGLVATKLSLLNLFSSSRPRYWPRLSSSLGKPQAI